MPWRRRRRRYNSHDLGMYAAATIPVPCSLFPVPCSLFPYFTDPAMASVKLFCRKKNMMTVGSVQMVTPAITTP